MYNDTISLIIPIYQTEKYLVETLNSVVEAIGILSNIEVLLIDDGSTDNSAEICKDFSNRYSYFRYIKKENEGVSATRNKGILLAQGKYVCFLDSDDFIDKYFFENVIKYIENKNFDICVFEYEDMPQKENGYVKRRSNRKPLFVNNVQTGRSLLANMIDTNIHISCCWGILYKKCFLCDNDVRFELGITSSEDYDFVNSAISKSKKIIYEDITSVIYRRYREGSATNTYDNNKAYHDIYIRKKWFEYASENELKSSFYANEFVEMLCRCDHRKKDFEILVTYFNDNMRIVKKATSKKSKILRFFCGILGTRKGLIAASNIIDSLSKIFYNK